MDRNELRGVLLLLAKIDEADGREDLDNEVAEALGRLPADARDAVSPGTNIFVEDLARWASRLLRVPLHDIQPVALGLFAPTKEQIASEVIRRYAARCLPSNRRTQR